MIRFLPALPALLAPCVVLGDLQDLRMEGGVTAVHAREADGSRFDTAISGDLFAFLPVSNGEWMVYVEAATATSADSLFNVYPESNADAGSAQDSDGGSRIQVSELNYRWNINGRNALTIGQIDPSAHLDRSRIANDENAHFLGASFVNNPTIEFPDYALGLMYRRHGSPGAPEITAILSSSDGLADNPGRSYRELIDISDAGKGIFGGLGARWSIDNTRIGVGGWYRSDNRPRLDNPGVEIDNYGVYGVYGWQAGNHGFNFRLGAARAAVSPAEFFIGAAYEGVTPFGAVGVALGKIYESDPSNDPDTDDTIHTEAFLRVPLFSLNSHITMALQYIENSAFDSSGNAIDAHALVAALRFHIWFGE